MVSWFQVILTPFLLEISLILTLTQCKLLPYTAQAPVSLSTYLSLTVITRFNFSNHRFENINSATEQKVKQTNKNVLGHVDNNSQNQDLNLGFPAPKPMFFLLYHARHWNNTCDSSTPSPDPCPSPSRFYFLKKFGFQMEKSTDCGSIECNTFLDKVIFTQCFFSLEELQKVQISRNAAWKFHSLISSKYFGIIIYLFS